MNVAKHLNVQKFIIWIGRNTPNARTVWRNHSTLNNCLRHSIHLRPIFLNGFHRATQSVANLYPTGIHLISCQNNWENNCALLRKNSCQRFFYRHHVAASTPLVMLVNRQTRWKEKQVHSSTAAQFGTNYRRRRPIGKIFPENMVKIEFMHSMEDIRIYQNRYNLVGEKARWSRVDHADEFPGIFRVDWTQSTILQLAYDYYGMDCVGQLEYYNYKTSEWKVVSDDVQNDAEMIKLFKGKGNRTMPLRLQSDFDDGKIAENIVDRKKLTKVEQLERTEAEAVRIIIHRAVETLRSERYVRISNAKLGRRRQHHQETDNDGITVTFVNSEKGENLKHDNNEKEKERCDDESSDTDDMTITSTKQWIIEQAGKDDFLASLLLSRPGALKHLVQCIHWDRAWK